MNEKEKVDSMLHQRKDVAEMTCRLTASDCQLLSFSDLSGKYRDSAVT